LTVIAAKAGQALPVLDRFHAEKPAWKSLYRQLAAKIAAGKRAKL
jgi:hypothetical protein